jgi:PIN domain nuclease of toxin-antitoxin system
MADPARPTFHGFEQLPLRDFAERAYLDDSMYVVLDRALICQAIAHGLTLATLDAQINRYPVLTLW